jgi:uncharacterized protein YacL
MNERSGLRMDQSSGNGNENIREHESAVGLIRRLLNEVSNLLGKEIALAKAEALEAMSKAKTGAISMATGGAVLFAGILVLLAAAVLALSHVVSDWLAALIVGSIVTILGYLMVHRGKNEFDTANFRPERTQQALKEDKEMLERRIT